MKGPSSDISDQLAVVAMANGYHFAKHKASSIACENCNELDGEIIPIWDVISGNADYLYGQCTFTFFEVMQ